MKYYNFRVGEDFNEVKILLLVFIGKVVFGIKGNIIYSILLILVS